MWLKVSQLVDLHFERNRVGAFLEGERSMVEACLEGESKRNNDLDGHKER
jgi:hypothetical protein